MTSRKIELADVQRWLLAAITEPLAPPQPDIDQLLSPSLQQSAAERLAIYRGAYLARLLEVLREQFPCTRFAVGDELFDQFAAAYLHMHPPRSYTLAKLADNLVDHLEKTRPADWGEFVVDLARLEHAIDRVFDTVGPEDLPPFTMPQDANDSLKLTLAPGLELHEFRHPVSSYYTDWKAGEQPKWSQPQPQFVALLRRDYIVRRHELTNVQYELLLAISRGLPLGETVAAASCAADEVEADNLAAEFGVWFAAWSASGFFAAAS
jgi:Putative DNA-binding domain